MEFALHEVVPADTNNRTQMGRVVVDPPNIMGSLASRRVGMILMCCNRAFLTEESYKKHEKETTNHGKAIDVSKLPTPKFVAETRKVSQDYDSSNINLWIVRKEGCARNLQFERVEDISPGQNEATGASTNAETGKCHLCDFKTTPAKLRRHMNVCHVPDGVKCEYCSCTFLLERGRNRHQISVHGIRKKSTVDFKSAIVARAKKQLVSSFKIKSVFNIKSGRTIYPCSVCGKSFPAKIRLIDHMNTHSGARPYKCDICGYRFSHCSNLARHQRRAHTENDKLFCTICNCSFSNNTLLVRHNNTMHPKKLRIKKLKSPKLEVSESNVMDEETKYSPPKNMPSLNVKCPAQNASGLFECHICHKELTSSQTWRGHMLIHQNLKPYKCEHCGVSFRLHSTRKCHIVSSHSGGDFKCKHCTCCFKSKLPLERHTAVYHSSRHKKGKPNKLQNVKTFDREQKKTKPMESPQKTGNVAGFKCNLCGAVVRLLEDFEIHKTLHNGKDRTQCNLCLKKFGSFVNVQIHKKRAHGDISLHINKCAFCCCRYKASQALFSHLVKEHEMTREDWNFDEKSLKPEARRRIQLKLCLFDTSQEDLRKTGESYNLKSDKSIEEVKRNSKQPIKQEDSKDGYECDICHMRFSLSRSISNHKKKAHNHGGFTCGLCPCRYHKMTWLKKHQLKVHGRLNLPHKEKQFKETKAESISSSPFGLSNQLRIGNFKCNLCNFKFKSDRSLAVHKQRSHFHSGKLKCDHCSCKFKAMQGLLVHLSFYHGRMGKRRQKQIKTTNFDDPVSEQANTKQESESVALDSQRTLKSINKFECDICHMKFAQRGCIWHHKKKAHFHSGKHKCLKCNCKFLTSSGLITHIKYHHKKGGIVKGITKTCVKSKFVKPKTLADSSRIECDLCHLIINRWRLKAHKESSHGSGSFSCPDCSCVFTMSQGLTRHRVFHHNFKGKILDNDSNASDDENAKSSEPETPSSTSKVNKNFLKIRSLPSSRRSSTRSASTSPSKSALSKEDETDTEFYPTKPPKPSTALTNYKFKCNLCGIKFTHSTYLKRHQQKAHTEGGISCEFCTCTFVNSGALGAHKRIYHSSMSSTDATVVDKQAKSNESKSNTTLNFNGSEIEASTSANTSEYKTRNKTKSKLEDNVSLEDKSEQHSDDSTNKNTNLQNSTQLNQCTWCLKTFASLKILEKHILSHTRPEICTLCGMRFRVKDEVTKHIKLAHDERSMHQCLVCSCRFATPAGLKAHNGLIHKKQSASYDNIVIEHDEGAVVDNEPFIETEPSYCQQNMENSSCEDSEPIIQGILQTNYSSEEVYENNQAFTGGIEEPTQEVEDEVYEDSVPIVEGYIEYHPDHEIEYCSTLPPPGRTVENKKAFSPKSRPIKCATCGITCYGPEKLRLHMQSRHQETEEDEIMQVDDNVSVDENVVKKCEKCSYEFPSSHDLAQHMQLEHDDSGLYRCAYCPCSMKTETNLRYHFMKYHSG